MSAELGEYDASFRNVTVHGSILPKPNLEDIALLFEIQSKA
jgi:hypothetical protein